jgi:thiamine-phosphate pyrophosphorylase
MADPQVLRLIDANANRCREGLRVVEDTARFVLGEPTLFRSVRTLRHKVDAVLRELYPSLVGSRDSVADEGRIVKEKGRTSIAAVVASNCRRAEEALRVLEEYGKLIKPQAGASFKQIRYAMYALEKKYMKSLQRETVPARKKVCQN